MTAENAKHRGPGRPKANRAWKVEQAEKMMEILEDTMEQAKLVIASWRERDAKAEYGLPAKSAEDLIRWTGALQEAWRKKSSDRISSLPSEQEEAA